MEASVASQKKKKKKKRKLHRKIFEMIEESNWGTSCKSSESNILKTQVIFL